jgi:hypothetical protein
VLQVVLFSEFITSASFGSKLAEVENYAEVTQEQFLIHKSGISPHHRFSISNMGDFSLIFT